VKRRLTALVAVAAALPYLAGGGLRTFVPLDDPQMVVESPHVLQGLSLDGVRWAFTSVEWGNWHPLTLLSHMLDVQLFGLWAAGHHLTSVALHGATAALLFVALARLTGAVRASLFAALVFAVHPLRVESVAWIAERKDVLAGLFFALVLLAWERYARRGGARRYALAAAALALGLAAKPTLVTAPLVLVLLDVWPLGRWRPGDGWRRLGRVLAEKAPLLAFSAASSVTVYLAQKRGGGMSALGPGPGVRLANAVVSYGAYLGKTVWPTDLAPYYPYPQAIPWGELALAAVALAAISALAWRHWRRRPWLAVGWLWFCGALVPMIGLVQVGSQAMADRATYLPAVGLAVAIAWSAGEAARVRHREAAAGAVALGVLAALSAVTAGQVGRWRDGETILRHTLAVTRDNWLVSNNLGALLAQQGRYDEAVALIEESIRLSPGNPDARYNLGLTLEGAGRLAEAASAYHEVLRLKPADRASREKLAQVLEQLERAGGQGPR
jgi:tetratricopeptide (TPR) repeat protein